MRAGDERALAELYDRYSESMYSLALALLGELADAEEVVADAFLRLWRASDYDAQRGSVGAYLAVVTRSNALDLLRRKRRRGRAEEARAAIDPEGLVLPVADPGDDPEESLEVSRKRARVREALGALSEKQRTVIGLAYFGGYTHSEIAERLSEPLGTVKSRLRDGMKKLRDVLPLATSVP